MSEVETENKPIHYKFPLPVLIKFPLLVIIWFVAAIVNPVMPYFPMEELGFTENFTMQVSYFTSIFQPYIPLIGAILADEYFGKWKIVILAAILHILFQTPLGMLMVYPSPNQVYFYFAYLIIHEISGFQGVVYGAFINEQFIMPYQEKQLKFYLLLCYWVHKAALTIMTFVGSRLLEKGCFGRQTCYAIPIWINYGVYYIYDGVLFALWKLWRKTPPHRSILLQFLQCISSALNRKFTTKSVVIKPRWIDHASEKFEESFRDDCWRTLKLVIFFIYYTIFNLVYTQMWTRFFYSAARMKGTLFSIFGYTTRLYPGDVIYVLNTAMVVIFLPIFEYLIFPLFAKINLFNTNLKRVALYAIFLIITMVMAASIEHVSSQDLPILPVLKEAQLRIFNSLNDEIEFSDLHEINGKIAPYGMDEKLHLKVTGSKKITFEITSSSTAIAYKQAIEVKENAATSVIITKEKIIQIQEFDNNEKTPRGRPKVRIMCDDNYIGKIRMYNYFFDISTVFSIPKLSHALTEEIKYGEYDIYINSNLILQKKLLDDGGVYVLLITKNGDKFNITTHVVTRPNHVPMYYIVPQIATASIGEIVAAVPWQMFTYTQSPPTMRSVIMAYQLFFSSNGYIIGSIVVAIGLERFKEYYLYAGLVVVTLILFTYTSYKYVPQKSHEASDSI